MAYSAVVPVVHCESVPAIVGAEHARVAGHAAGGGGGTGGIRAEIEYLSEDWSLH